MLLIRVENVSMVRVTQELREAVIGACTTPRAIGGPVFAMPMVTVGSRRQFDDDRRVVFIIESIGPARPRWNDDVRKELAERILAAVIPLFGPDTEVHVTVRGHDPSKDAHLKRNGRHGRHLRVIDP